MNNHDDPRGAAQQSAPEEMTPQVQRLIYEETKEPKPHHTVQPVGGAAISAPSIDSLPKVNQQSIVTVQQLADTNHATLQAF